MNLVIRGKNIEVPEKSREYIARKVDKFDRHLSNITETKVEISEERSRSQGNQYVVEMTLDCRGTFLRGEERGADIFSAVDAATNMMTRQISRYKERLQGRKRRLVASKGELVADQQQEGTLLRIKRFPVKAMSPDEAMEQMELLGHDFFVFFDDASGRFNVLYRRKGGTYGLIQPDVD
ncbi:ribosome-associated translation inhibitor RaiA [Dehalococcoidia bacterium]|nr:ribosome-associated translation inhibitor RaiA [Dehalococcoidia bacterium]